MLKLQIPKDKATLQKQIVAMDYQLLNDTCIKDRLIHQQALETLLGAFAEHVKGFDKLASKADMFKQFFKNFYLGWGYEARKTIVPFEVKCCKDDANGAYLRFEYEINGRKDWQHVKNATTWY